ncbi:hypothetical protein HG537_0B02220 [Torulaspora globosa]|uniref:Uncharacterized protein n=1 Tax=Torulaspora globosa TaxID=48254 RepID=A0A7H9HM62_9SACH|nr:hypothetical protein HG537_0B02220 [Torulaspora sp. CBS 2947]
MSSSESKEAINGAETLRRELPRAPPDLRNFILESFAIIPHRVIYLPFRHVVKGLRGSMKVPESYWRYPMLAVFFAKYRMQKYPYDYLSDDITWPEPYVVYNTIVKKMRAHKYLKNAPEEKKELLRKLMSGLAKDVVVPKGCENVVLETSSQERQETAKRTFTFPNSYILDKDVFEFFSSLFRPPDSHYWGEHDVSIELNCRFSRQQPTDIIDYSTALKVAFRKRTRGTSGGIS